MAEFVYAFLDCEFGGLDPELHDITEVAVIVTDYRLAELTRAEWKVRARPDRVSKDGAAISGWSAEAWADAPSVRTVLGELAGLLPAGKTVVPAGQNVRMDVQFLAHSLQRSVILPSDAASTRKTWPTVSRLQSWHSSSTDCRKVP